MKPTFTEIPSSQPSPLAKASGFQLPKRLFGINGFSRCRGRWLKSADSSCQKDSLESTALAVAETTG